MKYEITLLYPMISLSGFSSTSRHNFVYHPFELLIYVYIYNINLSLLLHKPTDSTNLPSLQSLIHSEWITIIYQLEYRWDKAIWAVFKRSSSSAGVSGNAYAAAYAAAYALAGIAHAQE